MLLILDSFKCRTGLAKSRSACIDPVLGKTVPVSEQHLLFCHVHFILPPYLCSTAAGATRWLSVHCQNSLCVWFSVEHGCPEQFDAEIGWQGETVSSTHMGMGFSLVNSPVVWRPLTKMEVIKHKTIIFFQFTGWKRKNRSSDIFIYALHKCLCKVRCLHIFKIQNGKDGFINYYVVLISCNKWFH